ncbi:MAG: GNAT family N-acetyltransferase [Hyphomicrobiales bacterium]|nr:GNAT family N-acetyltransferase [Hyphomicrobiales bacterium]
MTADPGPDPRPPPGVAPRVDFVPAPSLAYYRYLYNTVGADWLWWTRRAMDDATLAAIIGDPAVEVYVLSVDGEPAGYGELDRRDPRDVELAYFGLMPAQVGRGLGRYFLAWMVRRAWQPQPRRLWLNTCDMDHPRALDLYRRAGFQVYRRENRVIDDPRLAGLFD